MRKLLTALAVVLAGAGGVVAYVVANGSDGSTPTTRPIDDRPPADLTFVAGSAIAISLNPTLFEPIALPVTVEALERGAGAAEISPVTIGGRSGQSIAWPAGTPLVLESESGGGLLTLAPTLVEATVEGIAISLDGVTATLSPGTYRLEGSVALGGTGLAQPSDAVTFEATEATVVTVTGAIVLRLPPRSVTLEGPGEAVVVGDLEVTTAETDRRVEAFRSGPGPYRFDLVWAETVIEIEGRVEGPVAQIEPSTSTTGGPA